MKRAKIIAHDWSSGCLATAYSLEKLFSLTMASRFEIVDEECIEELKDKTENEKIARSDEITFSKSGRMKKLASKFRRVRERCPPPMAVAVLGIQKLSNFALYATRAIRATFENTHDINS